MVQFLRRPSVPSLHGCLIFVCCLALQAMPASGQTLLLHWRLDESAGTTATDSSGNGFSGSITGTAAWTTGVRSGALDLTSGAKLEVSNLLGQPASFTVAAWVNVDSVNSNGGVAVTIGDHITLVMDEPNYNSGKPAIGFTYSGSSYRFATGTNAAAGAGWHHFVGTFDDATDTLRLYVDGVLVSEQITTSSIDWSALGTTTCVGSVSYPISGYAMDGRIDDVRIYDAALSEDAVAELYSLVGHWRMDEPSGTTCIDSSSNNNDGTYTNSPVLGQSAVRGTGVQFNGSNDHVVLPALEVATNALSISAWVKADAFSGTASRIVAKANGTGQNDNFWTLTTHESGGSHYLSILLKTDSAGTVWITDSDNPLDVGEWMLLTAVYDGSQVRLYRDTQLIHTASLSGSVSAGAGVPVWIGGSPSNEKYWQGSIDDVRVYNHALTEPAIAELYGLIGHWQLEETSGSTANDSSGVSNHGTWSGGPNLGQPAPRLLGAEVTNSSQYMQVPSSSSLNSLTADGSDMTAALWVKPTAPDGHDRPLLHKGSANNERAPNLSLNFGDNRVQYAISADGNWNAGSTSTASLPADQWSHLVLVKEARQYRLYINGQLDSTRDVTGDSYGNSGPLYLGANPYSSGDPCAFDDLRLYNRAITDEEIAELSALDGLVGHWMLDELSGTDATDSSGYGNDGTYVNGPALGQSAIFESGVQFSADAGHDRVSIPSSTIDGETQVSIAWWMKTTKTGEQAILSGASNSYADANSFLVFFSNDTTFRPYMEGTNQSLSINSIADGQWHHCVFVHDRPSGDAELFIDGVSVGTLSFPPRTGTIDVSAGGLIIAEEQDSVGGGFVASQAFAGTLDDFRIYNYRLSEVEIAELYGLVGHWKMDEGSGSTFADATAFANDATINGAEWTSDCVGNIGIEFDGLGDTATTNSNFDPPEKGSVAFWFQSKGQVASRQRPWGVTSDYEMWIDNDGLMSCDVSTDGYQGGFITTDRVDDEDRWYHIVAQYDSNDDSYALYLNGELHKSGISTWNIQKQTENILTFGTRTGSSQYWKGAIRDFRVYNRWLVGSEIAAISGTAGHWNFDESSGTVATDSSVNGNDGTYDGPGLATTSIYAPENGTAVSFDGVDDYVEIPHANAMLADQGAVAFWFRTTQYTASQGLFSKDSSGFDSGGHLTVKLVGGKVNARLQSTSQSYEIESSGVAATKWTHVTFVWGPGGMHLYINGIEEDSDSYTGGLGTTSGGDGNSEPLVIGANSWHSGDLSASPLNEYLSGAMDDIRFYTRSLCPEEVYRVYHGGRSPGVRIIRWVEMR